MKKIEDFNFSSGLFPSVIFDNTHGHTAIIDATKRDSTDQISVPFKKAEHFYVPVPPLGTPGHISEKRDVSKSRI